MNPFTFTLGLIGGTAYILVVRHWKGAIYLLCLTLPFLGGLGVRYNSGALKLAKDFLFIIPCYFTFVLDKQRSFSEVRVPATAVVCGALAILAILLQCFNPYMPNKAACLLGVKVWLLYVPLIAVGSSMIETVEDLTRMFRFLVALAWIPCAVGLLQWYLSTVWGYEITMYLFFAEGAAEATHNFETFDFGSKFYRIPATFPYVTHYFNFTLAMVIPSYSLLYLEKKTSWRLFAGVSLLFIIMASTLSGARIAFLFIPVLLCIALALDGRLGLFLKVGLVVPLVASVASSIAGLDLGQIIETVRGLFLSYADDIATKHLLIAFKDAPWGRGTGSNTAAIRFVGANAFGLESFYAKAFYELGITGGAMIVFFFVALIIAGFQELNAIVDKRLRPVAAIMVAFLIANALNNFKGFALDWDPMNIYFWLFCGFMFKLRWLPENTETELTVPAPAVSGFQSPRPPTFQRPIPSP